MAKQAKFLVATDSRYPLTVALAYAFAANKITPELLVVRKRELVELVSEAAKTFGFQSKTTLASAFDMSVGLLSLALVSGTQGEILPDQWTERLVTVGWKELVKESISLARTIKEQDAAYDYLFETDQDPRMLRDHLRDFVFARDKHQQWIGYDAFIRYREERRRLQGQDALIRWLIKSLVKRPLYWMKDPIDGPTCAEEALNTLLFRTSAGLGFAQKDIILGEKDFRHARTQYEDKPAEWLKVGQQRYDSLLQSVPEELRGFMDDKWFSQLLGKGPPKFKKWDSDDLSGITGFYYYEIYL
jgi:hypothetical protein